MTKVADCARWLHDDYLQAGKKPVNDVEVAAQAEGYGRRTLHTAKARARVKSVREGGVTFWVNTTEVLIDQGAKPDNLVSAILELAAAIRESRGATASATHPTTLDPLWTPPTPFDTWTKEEYAAVSTEEASTRVKELKKELAHKKERHGKRVFVRGEGFKDEDFSVEIKEIEEEIVIAERAYIAAANREGVF